MKKSKKKGKMNLTANHLQNFYFQNIESAYLRCYYYSMKNITGPEKSRKATLEKCSLSQNVSIIYVFHFKDNYKINHNKFFHLINVFLCQAIFV